MKKKLAVIRIPDAMKLGHSVPQKGPELADGYREYEVSDAMKEFWDSLSEREKETFCNISMKEHRDLRDVLAEEM